MESIPYESLTSETQTATEEDLRLGGDPPLKTLLKMSVGPLSSSMCVFVNSLACSVFAARALGQEALGVLGAVFIVEFIPISFARYLMESLSLRASFLFGEQMKCDQMYIDFIRLAFLFGTITPAIVLPITKTVITWFGASQAVAELSFLYMIPGTGASCLNYIAMTCCGMLQAEGRSGIFGIGQGGIFIMSSSLLALFLLVLKLPVWGISLAIIVSQASFGLTMFFCFMGHKFTIRPEWSMFFRKFSCETKYALTNGIASFVCEISYSLPMLLLQKYIFSAAGDKYLIAADIWGANERLWSLLGGLCSGFFNGMIPCASYAFGAKRENRLLWLCIWNTIITTILVTIVGIFCICFPQTLARIWSDDPVFISYFVKMVPKAMYAICLMPNLFTVVGLVVALQKVGLSVFLSVLTLVVPYPIFSTILYFNDQHDFVRLYYTYTLSDIFSFIVGVIATIGMVRQLMKAPKEVYDASMPQHYRLASE